MPRRKNTTEADETTNNRRNSSNNNIRRWFVLFGTFYISFCVDGFLMSFGLLRLEIEREYPNVEKQSISVIGGLYATLYCLLAPLAMGLSEWLGLKFVVIGGAMLQVLGFMLAFANHWLQWGFPFDLLVIGIIPGIGAALLLGPSIVDIMSYFPDKREVATGITTAGSPAGALAYSFLFHQFMAATSLGWRGVMAFYAIMSAVMIALGFNFYRPDSHRKPEDDKLLELDENNITHQRPPRRRRTINNLLVALRVQFNRNIWSCKNWAFYVFLVATNFAILGYPVPTLLINGQAEDERYGVSKLVGKNLLVIWGIANVVGRFLTGPLASLGKYTKFCTSFSILISSFLLMAIGVLVFPHIMHFGDASFATFIAFYGLFAAPNISIRSCFLQDLFASNRETVKTSFGWQLVSDAIFAWIGFYVSTYLNNMSPLYASLFAGLAFVAAAGAIATTWSPFFKALEYQKKLNEQRKQEQAQAGENMPLQQQQQQQQQDDEPVVNEAIVSTQSGLL